MFKLNLVCPDIDLNDTAATQSLYQQYQNTVSSADQSVLLIQASQELEVRLIEEFGSTDYQNALLTMQANPDNYVDGRWGFSHAGLAIAALEALRLSGATHEQVQAEADRQVAYWYSREAVARCGDGIVDWMNPLNWSEDSRLDYMAVKLFVGWYVGLLW